MAQSASFSDIVWKVKHSYSLKRQRCDEAENEAIHSQAANAAITAISVKLSSGMDNMSVAVRLRAKELLSDNTLEAVRPRKQRTRVY